METRERNRYAAAGFVFSITDTSQAGKEKEN